MKPIFKADPIVDQLMDLTLACEAEGTELAAVELTEGEAHALCIELYEKTGTAIAPSNVNGMEFNGIELRVEDN